MSSLQMKKKIEIKPIQIKQPVQQKKAHEDKAAAVSELEKIHVEIEDLKRKREALLQATEEEIAAAKKDWEIEKERYIKAAQEKGYQDGFSRGYEESMEKYAEQLSEANRIVEAAVRDYHATVEKNEGIIVDIAISAAEKIVHEQMAEERNLFLSVVKEAIREIKDEEAITIFLHPGQYENVLRQKEELMRILNSDTKLFIKVNDELPEYGCLIEHPFGQIDASVDTQLEQIRHILHELALGKK